MNRERPQSRFLGLRSSRFVRHALPLLLTAGFFYVVFRRIPYERLLAALSEADYVRFFALMIPNAVMYIAWDTLVLAVAIRWFHGPVRYRDLLPVRATSYIVSMFNTNAGRGALAVFVGRLLGRSTLQIGSTVIFLVLTEYHPHGDLGDARDRGVRL